MLRLRNLAVMIGALALCASCVTSAPDDNASAKSAEDLSALDNSGAADNALEKDLDQSQAAQTPPADEFAQFEDPKPEATPEPAKDEFAQFEGPKAEPAPAPEPPAPAPEPPPEFNAQNDIPEPPKPEPPAEAQVAPTSSLVTIKALLFKGNDNGGTVIVEGDGPMTYSTRMNAASGQFTIDIPNTILPKKFTRPLITKDFEGMIGSVDAYQSPGSNVSRLIVHLREGSPEPVVQTEGSSLLVVANEIPQIPTKGEAEPGEVKILSYGSLDEFLAGNMNFTGKKISIETDQIEMRDLFKLISEEGGINMVISEEVKGTMSVKLRQVPWDQALVMIMKTKKLSYTRTGNVLRIAPIKDLQSEEEESIRLATAKKTVEPIVVKIIPISYSKFPDIQDQVKPFLSARGAVVSDTRTSALVVSDIQDNIQRVEKLVQSIDIPPQQVLIEGKIVEAQENFQRQIGVQWQAGGSPMAAGASSVGNMTATTSINVIPGQVNPQTGNINFTLGTLDLLGSLTAILALQESEGTAKVLSSPRIVTLHSEKAHIFQSTDLPIFTSNNNNGVITTNVSWKPVTLDLVVTPNVTNDGSVIMAVTVSREFAGSIVDTNSQARPINKRSADTKVMVKNGQTAVLGGIYQDDASENISKVPWIADVPIFGWLFKTKANTENKNELLIFLTPRILGRLDSQTLTAPEAEGGKL